MGLRPVALSLSLSLALSLSLSRSLFFRFFFSLLSASFSLSLSIPLSFSPSLSPSLSPLFVSFSRDHTLFVSLCFFLSLFSLISLYLSLSFQPWGVKQEPHFLVIGIVKVGTGRTPNLQKDDDSSLNDPRSGMCVQTTTLPSKRCCQVDITLSLIPLTVYISFMCRWVGMSIKKMLLALVYKFSTGNMCSQWKHRTPPYAGPLRFPPRFSGISHRALNESA